MYLAVHSDIRTSIDDIVEQCHSHRSQVVAAIQLLRKAGYISSSAGRSGGIWLTSNPKDVTLIEIVKLIENDFHIAKCFAEKKSDTCALRDVCMLRGGFKRALDAFFKELQKTTLQDLIENPDQLKAATANPA